MPIDELLSCKVFSLLVCSQYQCADMSWTHFECIELELILVEVLVLPDYLVDLRLMDDSIGF